MKNKKIFALLLALLFILPIVMACGDGDKTNPDISGGGISGNEETEEVSDPNARINKKDNLPNDLNFDGQEIRILLPLLNTMDYPEKSTGDIVNDAVYDKNTRVQERLNVKFSYGELPRGGDWSGALDDMKNMFLAGDDVYDLVSMSLAYCTYGSVTTVFYMEMQNMPYLDFDQPWWNKGSMLDISHDNKTIKYLVGEASLSSLAYAGAVFYNKNMYNDVYGDPDSLYGIALDGKWTFDYLSEKCKGLYVDVNGDGVADGDDQYGMTFEWWTFYNILCGAGDARRSSRDSDGIIQIDMDLNRLLTFCEKMYDLCYNNIGVDYYPGTAPLLTPLYLNRQMVFYPLYLHGAMGFRAMDDDYGILPLPKIDETQKEYKSLININTSVLCVPYTCKIPETVAAVLEASAAEGYRTVTEVYYEVALKTKYSRDDYSGQVIDLVNSTSYIDFLTTYVNHLNQSAFIVHQVVSQNKNTDLMSHYTKNENAYKTSLDKLITVLTEGIV
ncbi:MAG: hypothetical protein FWF15_03115 [Oscillospiraceae bacterium]|nr:hypothetical protein [Oscillospiraceae bacterium]